MKAGGVRAMVHRSKVLKREGRDIFSLGKLNFVEDKIELHVGTTQNLFECILCCVFFLDGLHCHPVQRDGCKQI